MIQIFEKPLYLLCAVLVFPAIGWELYYLTQFKKNAFSFFLHKEITPYSGIKKMVLLRMVFYVLAWLCLVAALAAPRWGIQMVPQRQEGASVMLAMDVSRSMTVRDVIPDRLSYAKEYASLLINHVDNARFGIVLIKGTSHLAIPVTHDYRTIYSLLDSLSPVLISSPGSEISGGLYTAMKAFPKESAAEKIIVLFTDGEETSGSLFEAAKDIKNQGIRLIIVGIGTEAGEQLTIVPNSTDFGFHTTKLKEDVLQKTAELSGPQGLYVNGQDSNSVLTILKILEQSGKEARLVFSPIKTYRYVEFLILAFIFLALGLIIGGRAWISKKRP